MSDLDHFDDEDPLDACDSEELEIEDTPTPATSTEGQAESWGPLMDYIELAHGIICNAHRARVDDVTEADGASPGWAEAARKWIDAYPPYELMPAPPSAPEPSTAEVLAGLVEEMFALADKLQVMGSDYRREQAAGVRQARWVVEAAQQRLAERGRGGGES